MLGGFSLIYGDTALTGTSVRSKRIKLLVEYLVINRSKNISQTELLDLIYPDDKSGNPLNALKTLVHRARATLDALGEGMGKRLILQNAGGYRWNNEITTTVDAERFGALADRAAETSSEDEKLRLSLEAVEIYEGDFLPDAAMDGWAVPITTYYHYLYMQTVHSAVILLNEREDYGEVIAVTQRALKVDPYDEELYYSLILSLAKTDQKQAAISQYERMTKLFYSEFGVTPSKEFQAVYKELVKTENGVENDIDIIKRSLREESEASGAFFCEYEFFKDIYQLQVRSASRNGKPIHICLISATGREGPLSTSSQNLAMQKLKDVIQSSLRRGDIYSRYSISQYILLLPQATFENGEMVLERIAKRFKKENPHSPAEISFSLQAIDAML